MTQNQIAYWKNVETERSNRENESEKRRSNLRSEDLKLSENLIKQQEANIKDKEAQIKDKEALIKAGQLSETQRANLANEYLRAREAKQKEDDTTLKYFFKAIEPLTGLAGLFSKSMIGG